MNKPKPDAPNIRDECIAFEAIKLTVRAVATKTNRSYREIADEAISKVDTEVINGTLGSLYLSWVTDPERQEL